MMMPSAETVILAAAVIAAAAVFIYTAANQRGKVIEWLKFAVAEAERQLGSGTGQLKLRAVYDRFIQKYPLTAALVPFAVFSRWVDTALGTVRHWLEVNKKVADHIGGD